MSRSSGRPRRWTDEQLRDAIANEHSWHGVMRAVGLKPTSANSKRAMQKTATALGLDTSHFTGQRRWSDLQLRDAVTRAARWADVLRILDLVDNSDNRTTAKSHAIRLGLDITHLRTIQVDDELPTDLFTAGALPHMLRVAAPSLATTWFTLRGMPVAVPAEPQVYDLLVTMPDGIQRVQVKSTTFRANDGAWQVTVGRRPYALDKSAGKAPYDTDSIDQFFIVDGVGRIYLVPSRVLAGRVKINIDSYAPYRVGDAASLLR